MRGLLTAALADPWEALRRVVDDPLHPGGEAATAALLDRAGVGAGTRLLEVGCGAGGALSQVRERGATAVGLDRQPAEGRDDAVRGDMRSLPVGDGCVDVVLAECVLCLSGDLPRSLAEARRVLADGGRLALSDVVVADPVPDLPAVLAEPLCLARPRKRTDLVASVEEAGFAVGDVRSHREDLLAMRDQVDERVDYETALGAMGLRGRQLLEGIEELEAALEEDRIGYVSLVASVDE